MRPPSWYRLARLLEHRGLLTSAPALRMVRYLADTDTVTKAGIITDVPAMLAAYSARCHVSKQTGYTDLGRLIEHGLIRQLQAAAPGYTASYCLSYPAALVDELRGLPPGLARELPHRRQAEDTEPGPPQAGGHAADVDEHQDHEAPATSPPCGGLDPSPSPREGQNPGHDRTERSRRCHHPPGGKTSSEEEAQAADVLAACRRRWLAQRGPHRMPGRAELARVEALTALALRHAGPGEVEQVLTGLVGSAADLPAVLAWRLSRIIDAAKHARHVPVDDEGRRSADRAARPPSPPPPAAAARLTALRARLGPDRIGPYVSRHDQACAEAQRGASWPAEPASTRRPAPARTAPRA